MVASAAVRLAPEDDNAKRRQILRGARSIFFDLGFDAASMGEIARAAGVSKGTLYVYFNDKNALFAAIVEQESIEQGALSYDFDPARDAEATLREFGGAFIQTLCGPQGGSTVRTVMAIAERMPELGRSFYERVVANSYDHLAGYIAAQVKAGRLAVPDCELAAAQFMETCKASLFLPFVFQVTPPPSPARIAEVVDSATRMFLAAYGVRKAS